MKKILIFEDIATLAFQPFIDLSSSGFENLSTKASREWLFSPSQIPSQWGAFMHFYGPTRKLLKKEGLLIEDQNFLHLNSHEIITHPVVQFLGSTSI